MLIENPRIPGSLNMNDKMIARPPIGVRSQRPSSPLTGSLFMEQSDSGSFLVVYTGVSNIDDGWERIGAQQERSTDFKFRQIINYSYLAGGYKSSSPWKSTHKTTNSTDQTTYIGELLDYPSSYSMGSCGDSIFYVWSVNTGGGWTGPTTVSDTYTSAINMVNETNYAHQSKFDLANNRSDVGVLWKERQYSYIFAGGTTTMEKFDMSNETMFSATLGSYNSSDGASAFSDEFYGYGWGSFGGFKFRFSDDTHISTATQWGAHGQQKGISSKVGKGYAGNEGSYAGGYNLRRWDNSTDTNIGNVPKPDPNCGEENFTMGQDWQYMLGNYNGLQNNNSWKFYYATDTGTNNVAGLNPAVNPGTSSGSCGWRQ
jgi:hypothetical protein